MSEIMVLMTEMNSKLENLEKKVELLRSPNSSQVMPDLRAQTPNSSCQKFEEDLQRRITRLESEVVGQTMAIQKVEIIIKNFTMSKEEASSSNISNSSCSIMEFRMLQLESWHQNFLQEYRTDLQMLIFNRDCEDFRRKGSTSSGIYLIYPIEGADPVRVYCDMETDNGGWTVIQRRGKFAASRLSFHQDWNAFKNGFGEPNQEFWLGNEAVHQLTNKTSKGYSLKVELRNSRNGTLWVALYRRFALGPEVSHSIHLFVPHIGPNYCLISSFCLPTARRLCFKCSFLHR